MSVPARRRQVAYGRERGLSARRACTLFSVARSALGYCSRKAVKDAKVGERMQGLAARYPRYGYRRIRVFLARDGHPMSPGRAYRLWRLAKLQVPPEVWQILIEYSPLPSSVSAKINQALQQAAQQPPPPDPEMMKIQAQTQGKQAELQAKAEADAKKAELDQATAQGKLALDREKMANDLEVEKVKLAIEAEKSRQEIQSMAEKHNMTIAHEQQKMVMQHAQHEQGLAWEDERQRRELNFRERSNQNELAFQKEKTATQAAKRRVAIKRDATGRMSEITEH